VEPAALLQFGSHISPWLGWMLAAVGVLVVGIAKSGFGGGLGIVGVVMFALAFGAQHGNAILLPILVASDIFSVYYHWGTWDGGVLRRLAPGTLLGILIGSMILLSAVRPATHAHSTADPVGTSATVAGGSAGQASVGKPVAITRVPNRRSGSIHVLDLITGIMSVLYVLLDQVRARWAPHWHLKADYKNGLLAGVAVGIASTLANAAGPISAIYLLGQGLPRAAFIGTTVLYFLATNTVKLIPYALIPGLIDWHSLLIGLYFLPLVPVGTGVGKWMSHRMDDRRFRTIMLSIVLVTGIQLCLEAITGISLLQLLRS
jgi:uncharacterized membrane protein YfcA